MFIIDLGKAEKKSNVEGDKNSDYVSGWHNKNTIKNVRKT